MSDFKLEIEQPTSDISFDSYEDGYGTEQPLMIDITLAEYRRLVSLDAIHSHEMHELFTQIHDLENQLTDEVTAHGATQNELANVTTQFERLKSELNLQEDS